MDAKPSRYGPAMANRGNENLPPMANKTIHQRNKSTGNLIGNMSAAINSSHQALKPIGRTNSIVSQGGFMPTAMDKENRSRANSKDAFLQPAQRPPKSLAAPVPTNQSNTTNNQAQRLPLAKQYPINKRGPPIVVYNDDRSGTEASSVQQQTNLMSQASTAPTSNAGLSQNWVITESEKGSWGAGFEDFHSDVLAASSHNDASSIAHSVEDEATEAVYLDAVEELPAEMYSSAMRQQRPASPNSECMSSAWHSPMLPESQQPVGLDSAQGYVMEANLPHYEEESTESHPSHLTTALADSQDDLSDYDETDYYDEQGFTTAHSFRDMSIMLPPRFTNKARAEIQAAKQIVEAKLATSEPDDEDWDIAMVTEYGDDIFAYMRERERELLPEPNYMDIQKDLQWSMRAVLIDWVIQVHGRFGLLPETLFLAVNYIDRFLSLKVVSVAKLQLVGATALLLAAKYEEINCPAVEEMVWVVDQGYSKQDIIKAERYMLTILEFAMGWPGPMSFMRRISKADDYDSEIRTIAKYFLEVTIMDERFVACPPSFLAAGAQCLARMILRKGTWTAEHVYYSGYTYTQLKPMMCVLFTCCKNARNHHEAVFEKYSSRVFKRASTFVEEQIRSGFIPPFQMEFDPQTSRDLYQEMHLIPHALSTAIPILG